MTETKINAAEYHTVRLEFDGWNAPGCTFKCTAPAESGCHLEWECNCDEIWSVETDEDGNRYHETEVEVPITHTSDEGVTYIEYEFEEQRHYASVNLNYCNYADWLDAVGTEALTGEITVAVRPEWDGDGFLFEIEGEVA